MHYPCTEHVVKDADGNIKHGNKMFHERQRLNVFVVDKYGVKKKIMRIELN